MSIYQSKPFWVFGIFIGIAFSTLMIIRLDLFTSLFPPSEVMKLPSVFEVAERDTWMNIIQNNNKIGYSHKEFYRDNDRYVLIETIHMRINTMGMVQDINMETKGRLYSDFTLSELDFKVSSGLFSFNVTAVMSEKGLNVKTGSAGNVNTFFIKLKKKPYLTAGIVYAVRATGLKPGDRFSFNIFDPATMGEEPVAVSIIGKEDFMNMGKNRKTTKVLILFKGAKQYAWIDENGEVIKEKGFLGINLERTTRKNALSDISLKASQDMAQVVSIKSNQKIDQKEQLKKLKIKISEIDFNQLMIDGGRQELKEDVLTVNRESLEGLSPGFKRKDLKTLVKVFLYPGVFIQSDHQEIKKRVKKIVDVENDTPLIRARKLVDWVFKNIKKQPVLSVPDALSTLENRVGDCNEHAVLLAALARAANIPARVETGVVYLNGRFYYHAWNLLYLGRWITADAVFNQLPADVTHIRFSSGARKQLDLMGVIGRVKLEVMSP